VHIVQEVKVLLITYFSLNSLIILVLAIGAVLAYVFREQVNSTKTRNVVLSFHFFHAIPSRSRLYLNIADDNIQSFNCCFNITDFRPCLEQVTVLNFVSVSSRLFNKLQKLATSEDGKYKDDLGCNPFRLF
jgi:hypothetical protein